MVSRTGHVMLFASARDVRPDGNIEGQEVSDKTLRVRFLPDGYMAPHRVADDLTERQREILQLLAARKSVALREIGAALREPPSDRRLREDLLHLKRLGLVVQSGYGRGSTWALERAHEK